MGLRGWGYGVMGAFPREGSVYHCEALVGLRSRCLATWQLHRRLATWQLDAAAEHLQQSISSVLGFCRTEARGELGRNADDTSRIDPESSQNQDKIYPESIQNQFRIVLKDLNDLNCFKRF